MVCHEELRFGFLIVTRATSERRVGHVSLTFPAPQQLIPRGVPKTNDAIRASGPYMRGLSPARSSKYSGETRRMRKGA